ncbi:MAG TPA: hypothetical protein VF517_10260 [Thermoleophilaceae bacterium]
MKPTSADSAPRELSRRRDHVLVKSAAGSQHVRNEFLRRRLQAVAAGLPETPARDPKDDAKSQAPALKRVEGSSTGARIFAPQFGNELSASDHAALWEDFVARWFGDDNEDATDELMRAVGDAIMSRDRDLVLEILDALWRDRWILDQTLAAWLREWSFSPQFGDFRARVRDAPEELDRAFDELRGAIAAAQDALDLDSFLARLHTLLPIAHYARRVADVADHPDAAKHSRFSEEAWVDATGVITRAVLGAAENKPGDMWVRSRVDALTPVRPEPRGLRRSLRYYVARLEFPRVWVDAVLEWQAGGGAPPSWLTTYDDLTLASLAVTAFPGGSSAAFRRPPAPSG